MKQWSKPRLLSLGVKLTKQHWGQTGRDAFWDGIAEQIPDTYGCIIDGIINGTGGS